MSQSLTYVEIDLKRCSLIYGESPCTASLTGSPITGTYKCYNSPNTCQDIANFTSSTLTLRFAIATDYLPNSISAIPSLVNVSTSPQVLAPGESLGKRESVSVTFEDHPFNDVGIDKYYAERGFDPYTKGTFWSKFVARWPYIQGSALRVVRGYVGETLEEMETRHYVVESTSGPDSDGNFSIAAKDFIVLLDGVKAQAPIASNGVLLAGIDDNDTAITLSPAGIGNLEYPASGVASIGDEQVTFTRSGDSITLTARGVDFSEASDHEAGETFQLGIYYNGEDPADIIYDLITNYSSVDSSIIPLSDWQTETGTYIARSYVAKILKPTSVKDLVNELINQVGLVIYSDTVNQKIILRALRQFIPLKTINDDIIIQDSFEADDQQDKRVSQVWTYCGQKNPLENLDEEKNYRLIIATLAENDVSVVEDRQESIRKIYSRWITVLADASATALNNIIIQRYKNAPRLFKFRLPATESPVLASAVNISNRNIQDSQGDPDSVIAQIISINKNESTYSLTAEEMTFAQEAATERIVVIDQDTYNFNLREAHDQIYTDPSPGDTVTLVISDGVKVGSQSTANNALVIGDWPSDSPGVEIIIINNGRIQGKGGEGGFGGGVGKNGKVGGPAFYTRYPVNFDNANGEIWSGGGGGGYGESSSAPFSPLPYGSGGAGYDPGGGAGVAATTEAGGSTPGSGGDGGDPGEDGEDGTGSGHGSGGNAGKAIDGDSYITFTDEGDIRGPRVN